MIICSLPLLSFPVFLVLQWIFQQPQTVATHQQQQVCVFIWFPLKSFTYKRGKFKFFQTLPWLNWLNKQQLYQSNVTVGHFKVIVLIQSFTLTLQNLLLTLKSFVLQIFVILSPKRHPLDSETKTHFGCFGGGASRFTANCAKGHQSYNQTELTLGSSYV